MNNPFVVEALREAFRRDLMDLPEGGRFAMSWSFSADSPEQAIERAVVNARILIEQNRRTQHAGAVRSLEWAADRWDLDLFEQRLAQFANAVGGEATN